MTMLSVQKIVAVENELHAAEQAEQEKADLWLKAQEEKFLAEQQKRLAEVEAESRKVQKEALEAAGQEAVTLVKSAEHRVSQLAGVSDDILCSVLHKHLVAIVSGEVP